MGVVTKGEVLKQAQRAMQEWSYYYYARDLYMYHQWCARVDEYCVRPNLRDPQRMIAALADAYRRGSRRRNPRNAHLYRIAFAGHPMLPLVLKEDWLGLGLNALIDVRGVYEQLNMYGRLAASTLLYGLLQSVCDQARVSQSVSESPLGSNFAIAQTGRPCHSTIPRTLRLLCTSLSTRNNCRDIYGMWESVSEVMCGRSANAEIHILCLHSLASGILDMKGMGCSKGRRLLSGMIIQWGGCFSGFVDNCEASGRGATGGEATLGGKPAEIDFCDEVICAAEAFIRAAEPLLRDFLTGKGRHPDDARMGSVVHFAKTLSIPHRTWYRRILEISDGA